VETPKETGNKLLNEINWKKPPNYNVANFLHKEISKLRCDKNSVSQYSYSSLSR